MQVYQFIQHRAWKSRKFGVLSVVRRAILTPQYRATSIAYRADRRATHMPNNTARRYFASLEGATTERLHAHDGCDRSPDPFGGSLDFPIAEMGVTQRHADVGVTEHP